MTEQNNTGTGQNGSTVSTEQFTALEGKYQRTLAELTDVKKSLDKFKDIDLDDIKGKLEDYELMKRDKASKDPKEFDAEVTRREGEIRKGVQKDIDGLKSTNSKLMSELKELKVVDRVFSIAAGKFNDDTHDDVKEYIRRMCDVDADGNIVVKGQDGKPRYAAGSTTKLMGPEDFVLWLSEAKPSWAKVTGKPGVKEGNTKQVNGQGTITLEQYNRMSSEEKARLPLSVSGPLARAAIR